MKFDRSQIDIVHMLETLGVQNVGISGTEVYYSCPFPGHATDDSTPSASMSLIEKPAKGGGHYPVTTFNCYACGAHGDAVSFVAQIMAVPPWTARQWLRQAYMRSFREPTDTLWGELESVINRPPSKLDEPLPEIDDIHLVDRLINWSDVEAAGKEAPEGLRYMLERGFDASTLIEWEIGWDGPSARIAIPVRDHDGRLVGFKGRRPDAGKVKYLVLGGGSYGFPTYEVGRVVFGLHRIGGGRVVIHEGELNAMATSAAGIPAVAVGKSHVTDEQLRLIVSKADSAVVWFDDDAAGAGGTDALVDVLHGYIPVRVCRTERDSADMSPLMRQEAVNAARSALFTGSRM